MATVSASDASKLSFPLQLVIYIVASFLAASGAVWATQRTNDAGFSRLQSDVRDILTKMEAEQRVAAINDKLLEANAKAMTDAITAMSKRQELQQLQIAELKESIIVLTSQGRK
jgi:hypothetical protein